MLRIEHNSSEFAFPFIEYAPENGGENLPIIFQLHGAGERGHGGKELHKVDIHGFSRFIKDKHLPCRFIMPQCPTESFWVAKIETLIGFIKQVIEHFSADKARVYLTGLSMGGFGTWYTAMAAPHLFAAIAPVCGGGMDWNAARLTMPVWAIHGDSDTVVNHAYSDMMINSLKDRNDDVTYTLLCGVGHGAWNHTYGEELYNWLLSKEKTDD